MHRVALIALEDCWLSSLGLPADVLHLANTRCRQLGRPEPEIHTLGLDQATEHFVGRNLSPVLTLEQQTGHYDVIILPALNHPFPTTDSNLGKLYTWLQDRHREGTAIAGMINGQVLIARAGLFDGKSAGVPPPLADAFRNAFPRVHLINDALAHDGNTLWCASTIGACVQFALGWIQRVLGEDIAHYCNEYCFQGLPNPTPTRLASPTPVAPEREDPQIKRIQSWLDEHFADHLKLEQVASRFAMSPRNLRRRFQQATGDSPHHYLQRCRITAAQRLLRNTHHTVEQIAREVGYTSATVFGRQFRRDVGITPNAYRRRKNGDPKP